MNRGTYSRAFFLGPGLPLTLGRPSGPRPLAAPADRLVPFFFEPSTGGAIVPGAGVPLAVAAGVAGFESDAFSPLTAPVVGCVLLGAGEAAADSGLLSSVGKAALSSGESLAGVSSLVGWGSRRSLSLSGETLRTMVRAPVAPLDLRRLTDDLDAGAMAMDDVACVCGREGNGAGEWLGGRQERCQRLDVLVWFCYQGGEPQWVCVWGDWGWGMDRKENGTG